MITLSTMSSMRRGFLRITGLGSLLLTGAASLTLSLGSVLSLAAGLAVGIGDNYIMLRGIESSAKKGGAMAFAGMKKNMLKRTAFVGLTLWLAVKARADALLFFLAFMLMHVTCLVFFIITARGGDVSPTCRKELNNGSRKSND